MVLRTAAQECRLDLARIVDHIVGQGEAKNILIERGKTVGLPTGNDDMLQTPHQSLLMGFAVLDPYAKAYFIAVGIAYGKSAGLEKGVLRDWLNGPIAFLEAIGQLANLYLVRHGEGCVGQGFRLAARKY